MQDIHPIYHNTLGVAFQWKRDTVRDRMKVQLVFRDTGLLLTKEELVLFSKNLKKTKENSSLCADCASNDSCKALMVDSPAPQITFAMNAKELEAVLDLVTGTLFHLDLDNYLGEIVKE